MFTAQNLSDDDAPQHEKSSSNPQQDDTQNDSLANQQFGSPNMSQLKRSAMTYTPGTWDLSSLKITSVDQTIQELETATTAFEQHKGTLSDAISQPDFMEILQDYESLISKQGRLYAYVTFQTHENSKDSAASAEKNKVEAALTKIQNRTLFFGHWFKKEASDATASQLIAQSGPYEYYLGRLREGAQFSLDANSEQLINTKNVNGIDRLKKVWSQITTPYKFSFQGKDLTYDEIATFAMSESAQEREESYRVRLDRFEQDKEVLAEIYSAVVSDWRAEGVGLRGYASPISQRNWGNAVSDEAVEALLSVVSQRQDMFHEYFELKREALGLPSMSRFDLYAKLPGSDAKVPYDEAVTTVLDAYREFRPDFADALQSVLDAGHVHAQVQENKRGGAYCWGQGTEILPYILLNYTETARDRATLAHEGGHAIHDIFAMRNTEFDWHPGLTLAETASTFCEALVNEKLLKDEPNRKKELLVGMLDDVYATVIRQVGFASFELKAHDMIEQGKSLEDLSDVYIDDLRQQLGPQVTVDDAFRTEWLAIPHMVQTPFYVYSYAFGQLLALGLYQKYTEQGDAFSDSIKELFANGGSNSTDEICAAVGIDVKDEAFWHTCFDRVQVLIDELKNELH